MILLTLVFAVFAAADPIIRQPHERFANILDIEAVLNQSSNTNGINGRNNHIWHRAELLKKFVMSPKKNGISTKFHTCNVQEELSEGEIKTIYFPPSTSYTNCQYIAFSPPGTYMQASCYLSLAQYPNDCFGFWPDFINSPTSASIHCGNIYPNMYFVTDNNYIGMAQRKEQNSFSFTYCMVEVLTRSNTSTDTPESSSTAASEASSTYTPDASSTAAPETSSTAAPEASSTAAPEASSTAAPEASSTAAPEASSTAAPEASATAAPETSSIATTSNECDCGTNGPSRIVGGGTASVHEHPWQANIHTGSSAFCGATLISHEYVLTAAHCCEVINPSSHSVTLGDHVHTTSGETTYEVQKGIAQVIMHENYNSDTVDNDVCIIKLDSPVTYSDGVFPACLPHNLVDEDLAGRTCTVTGWGTTSSNGIQPDELHEVDVTIVSQTECRNAYGTAAITDNMLCAAEDGKDSCQGDSGGPLVCSQDGKEVLVGVVSFGIGCADPDYPGVYARVTRYLDWITANTDGSVCVP